MSEPVKFVLRIPKPIHRKVKRDAKDNNTSMNKIIVDALAARYDGLSDSQKLTKILKLLEEE